MNILDFIEQRAEDEAPLRAKALRALLYVHRPEETGDQPPLLVCRHDQVAQSWGLYPCDTIRLLASMWSNHPDYQSEWSL